MPEEKSKLEGINIYSNEDEDTFQFKIKVRNNNDCKYFLIIPEELEAAKAVRTAGPAGQPGIKTVNFGRLLNTSASNYRFWPSGWLHQQGAPA